MSVDSSPVMIEQLKGRAEEEGLSNLKGQVMDGNQLDLDDNTFDIAGSQFGAMFFPDLRQGLSELLRVTRPGGTVFLVTFGPVRKGGCLGLVVSAVREVKPAFSPFPQDIVPLPFQGSEGGHLK